MKPKPVLQALVLAERVYQDVSGKKIIAGTFNRVSVRSRGALVEEQTAPDGKVTKFVAGGMHGGSPYAYISLTDVVDGTSLVLQFVDLNRNRVLLETRFEIANHHDRLATIELVVPLPLLPIPQPGTYAFEVVCEGDILGSHRIVAVKHPEPEVEE